MTKLYVNNPIGKLLMLQKRLFKERVSHGSTLVEKKVFTKQEFHSMTEVKYVAVIRQVFLLLR